MEKLLYSNHNNSCGVFYVVHFLSSSLWKRINEIAEFSDLNTLDQSTTYLAEAWQNINKTLYQPQNDEDYTAKDEAIKTIQCHSRVKGNGTHPTVTQECDKKLKQICPYKPFLPYNVYDKNCPNMTRARYAR